MGDSLCVSVCISTSVYIFVHASICISVRVSLHTPLHVLFMASTTKFTVTKCMELIELRRKFDRRFFVLPR